ncbi:hypothetical protein ACXR0O_28400 [Verrucomicrobiota bacterium sgz303538]
MRSWILLLFAVAGCTAWAQETGNAFPLGFKAPDPVVHQTPASDSPDQIVWRFFDLCTRGKGKEAWALAAPALQSRITPERLQRVVELAGVKNLPPISWTVQESAGAIARIRGDYLPSRRDPVHLSVMLLYEENAWRVYSAYSLAADMQQVDEVLFSPGESDDATKLPPLPTAASVEKDVRLYMGHLQTQVASESIRDRYATLGGPQRAIRTEPDMETLFRLLDRKLVIDPGAPIKVEINPKIGNEGFVGARGYVDVGVDSLELTLLYALTKRGWEVFGGTSRLLPGLPEIGRLTKETLGQFNDAVKRGSFDKFHEAISEGWKKQVSVEEMEKAFHSFIEQHVDISVISQMPTRLHARPTEGPVGIIQYGGHFETKPQELYFELKFQYEAPVWKLYGIDLKLQKPEPEPRSDAVVAP